MSRREIVLPVSRAIALLLVIPSLISFVLSIPTLLLTAYMRESILHALGSPALPNLFRSQGLGLLEGLLSVGIHVSVV
jgi:hypothetical protein